MNTSLIKENTLNVKELKARELARGLCELAEAIPTKANKARAEKAIYYLSNYNDSTLGRVTELASATDRTRKARVAKQGANDTHIKMEVNGKIKYVPCEVKTNGGRVENLYMKNAPKYVIYSMNVQNSLVKTPRVLAPIVIKTDLFLSVLEQCNAIKNTNGVNPERAIQATSKKLFARLSEYPIPYEPNTIYTADDFDDIEI